MTRASLEARGYGRYTAPKLAHASSSVHMLEEAANSVHSLAPPLSQRYEKMGEPIHPLDDSEHEHDNNDEPEDTPTRSRAAPPAVKLDSSRIDTVDGGLRHTTSGRSLKKKAKRRNLSDDIDPAELRAALDANGSTQTLIRHPVGDAVHDCAAGPSKLENVNSRRAIGDVHGAASTFEVDVHAPTVNRFTLNKQVPESRIAPETTSSLAGGLTPGITNQDSVRELLGAASSKHSAYAESSTDEDNSAGHTVSKRPLDSSPTPRRVTLADLDAIPFSVPATDTLPLAARLADLGNMTQEQQITLFASLSDAERSEAANFFATSFTADTNRLMAVRAARRKLALRFENDVRMRNKVVETKKADVQAELQSLNAGGAALLGARLR